MKRQGCSYWLKHYERWLQSSSGKVLFAREHHLSISVFYYWSGTFEKDNIRPKERFNDKGGFRQISPPLDIHTPTSAGIVNDASVILRYPSGVSIEWWGLVDIHLLKALLN